MPISSDHDRQMESHMGIARQYVLADWPATESRNLTPGKAEGR